MKKLISLVGVFIMLISSVTCYAADKNYHYDNTGKIVADDNFTLGYGANNRIVAVPDDVKDWCHIIVNDYYGNGNILGYDKVHHKKGREINPETGLPYTTTFTYVRNEEQARTVEKIFELCISGCGSKKIQRYLIQEGYLTATGTTKWQESTINRILNNPTYMGYNAYGKSKVVDYLSHEKEYCTDLDELQLVKGDWEPIVSEEIWYKALEERAKRKVYIKKEDNSISKYGQPSEMNMWIRKLQCSCGCGFRRNKWRQNSLSKEAIYGFECWNQVNNGSLKSKEKLGLPAEGACNVGHLQECKLDLMAKYIFEIIWRDRKESMKRAIEMITECSKRTIVDNSDKIASYKKKIATEEASQIKTVELVSKGLIPESLLTKVISESTNKIEQYKKAIEELSNTTEDDFDKTKILRDIENAFSTMIDFDVPVIDYNIIDRFIKKIIVREDSEFIWILNFNKLINTKPIERINHLSEEYKKTLIVDTNFNIFLEFEISVNECAEYMETRGRRIRKGCWKPLKVKVAIDLNN